MDNENIIKNIKKLKIFYENKINNNDININKDNFIENLNKNKYFDIYINNYLINFIFKDKNLLTNNEIINKLEEILFNLEIKDNCNFLYNLQENNNIKNLMNENEKLENNFSNENSISQIEDTISSENYEESIIKNLENNYNKKSIENNNNINDNKIMNNKNYDIKLIFRNKIEKDIQNFNNQNNNIDNKNIIQQNNKKSNLHSNFNSIVKPMNNFKYEFIESLISPKKSNNPSTYLYINKNNNSNIQKSRSKILLNISSKLYKNNYLFKEKYNNLLSEINKVPVNNKNPYSNRDNILKNYTINSTKYNVGNNYSIYKKLNEKSKINYIFKNPIHFSTNNSQLSLNKKKILNLKIKSNINNKIKNINDNNLNERNNTIYSNFRKKIFF